MNSFIKWRTCHRIRAESEIRGSGVLINMSKDQDDMFACLGSTTRTPLRPVSTRTLRCGHSKLRTM